MGRLVRTSLAMEKELAGHLDSLLAASRCTNRSEFIRELVREKLVQEEWEQDAEALGTITLVYEHDRRELSRRLVSLQHRHKATVLASTHVHLDHHLCAEMIMVRGRATSIRGLAGLLRSQKGVLHAALAMSTIGRRVRPGHAHP